jgi:hypothetical protein
MTQEDMYVMERRNGPGGTLQENGEIEKKDGAAVPARTGKETNGQTLRPSLCPRLSKSQRPNLEQLVSLANRRTAFHAQTQEILFT